MAVKEVALARSLWVIEARQKQREGMASIHYIPGGPLAGQPENQPCGACRVAIPGHLPYVSFELDEPLPVIPVGNDPPQIRYRLICRECAQAAASGRRWAELEKARRVFSQVLDCWDRQRAGELREMEREMERAGMIVRHFVAEATFANAERAAAKCLGEIRRGLKE